ncbi:hypothetical protein [Bacillus cereus group sp. BfR-BA-00999]|uniref:hypothetical protein n=1 Tax=unclassified Bacillus cereus group TaxID=2750818 RepID=UPI0029C3EF70|nr:hypothetical protein [Bacillus cereus group sp. BfR-BA-00999]MDX5884918.1 hypothetical protein [Bacillus cereus group sp. BfR-BA-00999]
MIKVEMEKEDLFAIIGVLIKVKASYGVTNERFEGLLQNLLVQASESVTVEEMQQMLKDLNK